MPHRPQYFGDFGVDSADRRVQGALETVEDQVQAEHELVAVVVAGSENMLERELGERTRSVRSCHQWVINPEFPVGRSARSQSLAVSPISAPPSPTVALPPSHHRPRQNRYRSCRELVPNPPVVAVLLFASQRGYV